MENNKESIQRVAEILKDLNIESLAILYGGAKMLKAQQAVMQAKYADAIAKSSAE